MQIYVKIVLTVKNVRLQGAQQARCQHRRLLFKYTGCSTPLKFLQCPPESFVDFHKAPSFNRAKPSPHKSSVRAIKAGSFGQKQINKPSNQKSVSCYWHKMSWQGWASHGVLHEVKQLILKVMECEINEETRQRAKDLWQTESGRPDRICVRAQPRQMRHRRWGKPFPVTRCKPATWASQAAGLAIGLGRGLARSWLSLNLRSQ